MKAKFTASKLRENVYRILDKVIETGVPIEIERKGVTLKLSSEKKYSRISKIKKRDWIVGKSEDLLNLDWSDTWSENISSKTK